MRCEPLRGQTVSLCCFITQGSRAGWFSCYVVSDSEDPMDCSPPGSVHGISQARTLEGVAISSSRGASDSGVEPESPALQVVSCVAGGLFTDPATGEAGWAGTPHQRRRPLWR